jgi:glycosyltransferase involved in cell wall biosynthesis
LRVLLVTARYFPYSGGIETHVYEVARRLARTGTDVTVLTTDPSGDLPASEEVDGVQIRRVPAWPRGVDDYYFAPGIYQVVAQGGWDVVHCQGSHTLVPPLVMLGALRARIPYVVTFHTGTHSSRLRNTLRGLHWAALRPLFRRAAQFVAVSGFEEEFFSRTLGVSRRRFVRIPNGSDLPDQGANPTTAEPGLIISVGRLERFKGHQRVIAALPQVRQQWPDARLWILGAGPYRSALESLARELGVADAVEIRTIPPDDRQSMASTLSRAGLVTLLSDGESHPVAVMEALALRRSVLVANSPGLQELAERGLVRGIPLASTPGEVAESMLRLMREPMEPPEITLPTWQQCADDLLAVYQSVAGRPACAS